MTKFLSLARGASQKEETERRNKRRKRGRLSSSSDNLSVALRKAIGRREGNDVSVGTHKKKKICRKKPKFGVVACATRGEEEETAVPVGEEDEEEGGDALNPPPGSLVLNWEDFHRDAVALASLLRGDAEEEKERGGAGSPFKNATNVGEGQGEGERNKEKRYKGIVAVTRGGLFPAGVIASELGVKLVDTACLSSYRGQERMELSELKRARAVSRKGEGWLIVDDLADSGATMRKLRKAFPKGTFAALYTKPDGEESVDVFVKRVRQHVWVVFPWERPPTFTEVW
uniref:Phosphoribosyltransferase domain-containing protein n=1 Tax=Chromera velia CCMP2878 TaxID=1169474 RepID=A0A0G4HD62_9ALVE|eukprot:Cvel_26440.t1-p1 / transcript=Cvel_26440.t1 / gene=Cvel_26440 / organism=Chromera_velia_CCMP2878 / gene_product=Xanthine phosphoribosyltransferase, putative / transcript_product=Xanthine phosphoribosyltransferase, putative / location=Cvel_scaffold3142:10044-12740(+) / protein_length=285 / sequence_SO=supercontig / SO=protein_coding / is_pseudo=false